DLAHPAMQPVRDPLRSLIYTASERAVRDVYVDGLRVVADGHPVQIDVQGATDALQRYQDEGLAGASERDWA
ncbi:MAG: N-ethylammeline chlorohydrolase, partial [Gammaproteobacteria bacterium]|nr:N-ethylammeline chlorohydrolase [Gammaproteobacteria bacterium]